jgi:hypothetical protein
MERGDLIGPLPVRAFAQSAPLPPTLSSRRARFVVATPEDKVEAVV